MHGFSLPRDFERLDLAGVHPSGTGYYSYVSGEPRNAHLKSDDLLDLHRILVDLDMHAELTSFTQKLQEDAPYVGASSMVTLVLPYLHGAIQLWKSKNSALSIPAPQALSATILGEYIKRYVGMEPPHPNDWTKEAKGCGSCQLDAFLTSPTEVVEIFRMSANRRSHIAMRFGRSSPPGFSLTTQRSGNPQTLVVKKTQKDGQVELREWRSRAAQAKKTIASIASEEDLRAVLGDAFHEIMDLTAVSRSRPKASKKSETTKRKADVLTQTDVQAAKRTKKSRVKDESESDRRSSASAFWS